MYAPAACRAEEGRLQALLQQLQDANAKLSALVADEESWLTTPLASHIAPLAVGPLSIEDEEYLENELGSLLGGSRDLDRDMQSRGGASLTSIDLLGGPSGQGGGGGGGGGGGVAVASMSMERGSVASAVPGSDAPLGAAQLDADVASSVGTG